MNQLAEIFMKMKSCNSCVRISFLMLPIVLIFSDRCFAYPSTQEEESALNSDYKLARTGSTRDDSNLFSSPGESSGDEGGIMSVQTGTTRLNDYGLFSSPYLKRREHFLISLRHSLLDQIRGEGRSDNEIPWHKRLGRFILSVIQYGTDRLQVRYGNRNNVQEQEANMNSVNKFRITLMASQLCQEHPYQMSANLTCEL